MIDDHLRQECPQVLEQCKQCRKQDKRELFWRGSHTCASRGDQDRAEKDARVPAGSRDDLQGKDHQI